MEQALPKVLGILGGLGPMATVYFYEMLTRHTQAARDQDHIDVIINPGNTEPMYQRLLADARLLEECGCTVIAIPCNTAHYFYDRLNETIPIPILNMVEETVLAAKAGGSARVGILATTGTVRTRTYQRMCEKHGLPCAVPDDAAQAAVMDVIYGDIKQGRPADMAAFERAAASLRAQGCDRAILGCTELSAAFGEDRSASALPVVDPLDVLVLCSEMCIRDSRGPAPRQTGGNT